MTLDEAIKHAEEVADGHDRIKQIKAVTLEECRCAEEHRQLAEWLKDYQRLLEEQHVDDAKKHFEIIYKLSQACGFTYSFVEEKIKETEKALLEASPQPCGDCISRQEVLDALNKSKYSNDFCKEHHIDWSINLSIARIVVNELKPVAPQPKMGRWVLKKDIDGKTCGVCSECGGIQYAGYLNYCPYCGVKMQEVEE